MNIRINPGIIRSSLTILLLTCSLICQADVTFITRYKESAVRPDVSLYKDGERLYKGTTPNAKSSVTIVTDDNIDTYTYVTEFHHKGSVNNGESVTLKTGLFIYSVHDSDGNPLSDVRVTIYDDGNEVEAMSTNNNGIASCYLAESDKYAYLSSGYSSGAFAITADEETCIEESANRVSVMLKYQDIPAEGTYYLVAYDGTESSSASISSSSFSGRLKFGCKYGKSYRIRNSYDVYSEPFTPTADNNSFVVENRKVTFISGSDDPNVLYNFKVFGANQSSNNLSKKVSDGKGYVVYYLMPGKYKYSHLGSMVPFEVGDSDIAITLTPNKKAIRLIDISGNGVAKQKVEIFDSNGGEPREYISDDSGTVSLKDISGDLYAKVNGFGKFPVGKSDIDILLTELVFDSPVFENSSIYLKDGTTTLYTITHGNHIWVPTDGQYTYSVYNNGGYRVGDTDIDLTDRSVYVGTDLNVVTFIATAESGAPLAGLSLHVYRGNITSQCTMETDEYGQCRAYLKDGFYTFNILSPFMQTIESAYIDGDRTIRCTVPNEISITVNVDEQPWNGYVLFTRENGESFNMQCYQGVGKIRISENERCTVNISGTMAQTCKVKATDGMTLDFYKTRVVSEGDGLAFPLMSYHNETQTKMLGGENLHLVAVPAANSSFKYWLINGEVYESSVVDYKVSAAIDAVAVFEDSEDSIKETISSSKGSLDVRVKDDCLIFNKDVNGNVDLYNANGAKVLSAYVVSDKIDISDLAAGVYVAVLTEKSAQYSAKFMK